MTSETIPDVPDEIAQMMTDDELDNMRSLDGWAVGTVSLFEDSRSKVVIDDAWIELFNGEGRAGEFGGIRFMGIDDSGELIEAYGYADLDALAGNEPGWYVKSFMVPDDPDVGKKKPGGV